MKRKSKFLVVMLIIALLISNMQFAFATEPVGNSFVFTAMDDSEVFIEPTEIQYTNGQTIKEALKASGYEFTGIDQGFISAVEGRVDNFCMFYDNNAYSLDAKASSVKKAIVFTTRTDAYSEEYLDLVVLLNAHNAKDSVVKNYTEVKESYKAAIDGLLTANTAKAKTLADNLNKAYQNCEAWMNSGICQFNLFTYHKSDESTFVKADKITYTDEYGNEYVVKDTDKPYALRKSTYSFVAEKDNVDVRGTFTITDADVDAGQKVIGACLPSGEWFKDIDVLNKSNGVAYQSEKDSVAKKNVYYVPDFESAAYAYFVPGDDLPDDPSKVKTFGDYVGTDGKYKGEGNLNRGWNSKTTSFPFLIKAGTEGREFRVKAVYVDDAGHTQNYYYGMEIVRTPSLKDLTVTNEGAKLFTFDNTKQEYTVQVITDKITVSGTPYAAYKDGYSVKVNGQSQLEGGSVSLDVNDGDVVKVTVSYTNGQSTDYNIKITKVEVKTVEVTKEKNVSVHLLTTTGSVIEPKEVTDTKATFLVAPGQYTWITTLKNDYHAKGIVAVSNTATEAIQVTGATPVEETLITNIDVKAGTGNTAMVFESNADFTWQNHSYIYYVADDVTNFAPWISKVDKTIIVEHESYVKKNGSVQAKSTFAQNTVTNAKKNLTQFVGEGGKGNTVIITARKTSGNVTYYQEYKLEAVRVATISNLEIKDVVEKVYTLMQNGSADETGFDPDVKDYTIEVNEKAESLDFTVGFPGDDETTEVTGNYTVTIDGKAYERDIPEKVVTQTVKLDTSKAEETFTIVSKSEFEKNVTSVYTIKVVKVPALKVSFNLTPETGNILLIDDFDGSRIWPEEDGTFTLMQGASFTYSATAYGYMGTTGTFVVDEAKTIDVTLEKAEINASIDKDIEAAWPLFRYDSENNGVIDYKTPIKAEDTVLYWANKIGEGYSGGATGCPILVDGYLYTYASKSIIKVDTMTGEVVASGNMANASAFAINSPTYAEGMIFVAQSGHVQAFNAKTLESLWVYTDAIGGQPNCPIVYHDGYIYTGFWKSETAQANFVCLSVTDEDPSKETESKMASWTYKAAGFYWAGAYACDDFVLVGTDDGDSGYTTGYGDLVSLDPRTGKVIDIIENGFKGDIRSSITFDKTTNKCYFTTKGGYFCSVTVNKDGTFVEGSDTRLYLYNYNNDESTPPMSTSTPVIYNGRAYIGVSGAGQFSNYSGHNITVIDLEGKTPKIAYTVRTKGYPQTSGLLTTAYDEGDGTNYVYFIDNATPGQLRVLKDKPGQTKAELVDVESVVVSGETVNYDTAYTLFTPYGAQAQYAICSPIADEYGNIYFKNDSAYMMMIGPTITKLEVTKQPDRTKYAVGNKFNATGMVVTATYSNGTTRDVTKYVSYTKDALTMDDTEIDIVFDIGENMMMYQNKDGQAGQPYYVPHATVNISIVEQQCATHTIDDMETIRVVKEPNCKEYGARIVGCKVCGFQAQFRDEPNGKHVFGEWELTDNVVLNGTVLTAETVRTCTVKNCGETEPGQHIQNITVKSEKTEVGGAVVTVSDADKSALIFTAIKSVEKALTDDTAKAKILEAMKNDEEIYLQVNIDGTVEESQDVLIKQTIGNDATILNSIDISMSIMAGDVEVMSVDKADGALTVTVEIPADAVKANRTFNVFFSDGSVAKCIDSSIDENAITVETETLGAFAVVYSEQAEKTPETGDEKTPEAEDEKTPETGDENNLAGWMFLMVVMAAAVVTINRRREN